MFSVWLSLFINEIFTKLLSSKVCSDKKYMAHLMAVALLCLICFLTAAI